MKVFAKQQVKKCFLHYLLSQSSCHRNEIPMRSNITSSIFLEMFICQLIVSLKLHCKCTAATSKICIILIKEPSTRHLLGLFLPNKNFHITILTFSSQGFFSSLFFCSILILFCLDRSKISNLIRHSYLRASSFHSLFPCFYFIWLDINKVFNPIVYKL